MEHTFKFESVGAWLDAATAPTDMEEARRSSRRIGSHAEKFRQTRDFSEALHLARYGWPEGARRAREIAATVSRELQRQPAPRREWRRAVYPGGPLLVPAYLKGEPDCFLHPAKIATNQFIRFVFNVTASSGIDVDVMMKRGTVAAALAEQLELRGYRVKLELAFGTYIRQTSLEELITLKNFNESLELDRVAFFLAHPASLRRIWMSHAETLDAQTREQLNIGGTYGHPKETRADWLDDKTIYLGAASFKDLHWHTTEGALMVLRARLKEKGIEI